MSYIKGCYFVDFLNEILSNEGDLRIYIFMVRSMLPKTVMCSNMVTENPNIASLRICEKHLQTETKIFFLRNITLKHY